MDEDRPPEGMEGIETGGQHQQEAKEDRNSPFSFQPAVVLGDLVNLVCAVVLEEVAGRRAVSVRAPKQMTPMHLFAGIGDMRRLFRPF